MLSSPAKQFCMYIYIYNEGNCYQTLATSSFIKNKIRVKAKTFYMAFDQQQDTTL